VHQHLWKDSSSFHPVHPLIRAFGPKVLHHAKGHCQSVLSFTAAFERTCELFFKAFSLKHGLTLEHTDSMWKELKNQSERQYGAFCLAYCITTHIPWRAGTKMVEFRNSVVHKGYIATKSEAEVYAQYVTENLDRVIGCLNAHFDKECREIYFHTKQSIRPSIEKIMKANPGSKFSATGQPSLLHWNHPNRESMSFSDVIKRSDELDTKFPH
jgi:hypothetical protein